MSNPSLILPQSPAYGEDYVYAAQVYDGEVPVYDVLPLTFTRASGGSRINKDGLVQNMPYNLVEYSEQFDNAYWNKYQSSITANSTANPINGQTTADQLVYTTTGTAVLYTTSSALANQVYALSCYGKKGTTNILQIGFTLGTGDKIANFNLNTGVITTTSSGVTANIESVGNGWYRCTMSLTPDINTPNIFVNSTSGTTGEYIYIFGGQLNIGSTAQPYLATTDRLNMPRITYPVGGGCGALLLEKQSTNQILYSEQFENAAWTKEPGNSITTNSTISPDGTQNADTITATAGSELNTYQFINTTAGVFAYSVYVKKNATNLISIYIYQAAVGFKARGEINFDNGTFTTSIGTGAIESMGNGWFKVYLTTTLLTAQHSFGFYTDSTTGTRNVYAWGGQVEQSSYATSYISTTSATSTRIADVCLTTSVPNLIGQTEGTLFVEMVRTNTLETFFVMLSNIMGTTANAYQNSVYLFQLSNGNFICDIWAGNVPQVTSSTTYLSVGTHKLAVAYKQNDFVVYVDGVQRVVDTSGNVPALNYLTLAGAVDGGAVQNIINETILYKTRLTNAELAILTTL